MAKFKLGAGLDVEMLTQDELRAELASNAAAMRAPYQAVSFIRLPVITAQGTNPFSAGGDSGGPLHTPDMGYVWSLRHLVIQGLTRGGTPDAVQIFRGQLVIWELNGNQYAQTFGRGEIMINEGETLAYKSIGTFAATGQISIHGMAWQVPSQFAAELVT